MKVIFAVLLALGTGAIGFFAGGGLGLLGGGVAGAGFGSINGICMAVDTAGNKGILTQAQIEQLGNEIAKSNPDFAQILQNTNPSIDSAGKYCKQVLQVMAKASNSSK